MKKICKKKAAFRVEFQIYAGTEEEFQRMCDDVVLTLHDMKEIITTYEPKGEICSAILGIAQVASIRRLAK